MGVPRGVWPYARRTRPPLRVHTYTASISPRNSGWAPDERPRSRPVSSLTAKRSRLRRAQCAGGSVAYAQKHMADTSESPVEQDSAEADGSGRASATSAADQPDPEHGVQAPLLAVLASNWRERLQRSVVGGQRGHQEKQLCDGLARMVYAVLVPNRDSQDAGRCAAGRRRELQRARLPRVARSLPDFVATSDGNGNRRSRLISVRRDRSHLGPTELSRIGETSQGAASRSCETV